jgi:tetratricopeptide (TPR) repeat protein
LENLLDSALFFINKESDAIRKEIVLPIILYALGRANESDARLENAINKYRNLQAQWLAMNYALRGDSKKALDLLEQAYKNQEYGIHHIRNTPMFKNIRHHPRFIALLKKMNMAADVK